MNENKYKKRLDFQQKMIARQSEQIESLKSQIEKLELNLREKDNVINSIIPMKKELAQNIADAKKSKKEYKKLVDELRKMKNVMNETVYNGRWWFIRFFIK